MNFAYALSILSGVTFSVASGLTNFLYALGKSDDLSTQVLWCSVALAASVSLAVSPTALLTAFRQRSWGGAIVALMAFLLCGAYSLSGALGSAVGVRLASEARATDTDSRKVRAQETYDQAKKELDAIAHAIGTKALKRKADLTAIMEGATRELSSLGPTKPVNTDALAIATYLALIGVYVEASDLNKWLALLAVLLVEFGGGLSFALSASLRPNTTKNHPTPREDNLDPLERRLVELVSRNGGPMMTSNRPLGKALGVSHVTASKVVEALHKKGVLQATKGKNGTVLAVRT